MTNHHQHRYNLEPTNSVFNFQKAHYRVTRDIANYWGGTPVTLYVNRMGTNGSAADCDDPTLARQQPIIATAEQPDWPTAISRLQPGSDYATPDPANNIGIVGLVHDFIHRPTYDGTFTLPVGQRRV